MLYHVGETKMEKLLIAYNIPISIYFVYITGLSGGSNNLLKSVVSVSLVVRKET